MDEIELKSLIDFNNISKFIDEALIKKIYFKYFKEIVNKHGWEFKEREYHQEDINPINSLLSLYYSLIYKDTLNSLYKQGLDPRISFIHAVNNRNKETLQYDISDHYKILLVDRMIIKFISSGKIKKEFFTNQGQVSNEYIKEVFKLYDEFMNKKYTYNEGKLTGYQLIDKQVKIYKNFLLKEEKLKGIKIK